MMKYCSSHILLFTHSLTNSISFNHYTLLLLLLFNFQYDTKRYLINRYLFLGCDLQKKKKKNGGNICLIVVEERQSDDFENSKKVDEGMLKSEPSTHLVL